MHQPKTFIINLNERIDRLMLVQDEMKKMGFEYNVVSATEHECGKLGLIMTMRELLEYCVDLNENVLILEDDVKFLHGSELFGKVIAELPEDFDLLYLGCNLCEKPRMRFSKHLLQVTQAYATHAILYSPKGVEKALVAISRYPLDEKITPLDMIYQHYIQPDLNCYAAIPMIATQHNLFSDIEGCEVSYDELLENRFLKNTQHL